METLPLELVKIVTSLPEAESWRQEQHRQQERARLAGEIETVRKQQETELPLLEQHEEAMRVEVEKARAAYESAREAHEEAFRAHTAERWALSFEYDRLRSQF